MWQHELSCGVFQKPYQPRCGEDVRHDLVRKINGMLCLDDKSKRIDRPDAWLTFHIRYKGVNS